MKKEYSTPIITTEKVKMGVFGCYGGSSGNNFGGYQHNWGSFWRWFKKFFHM